MLILFKIIYFHFLLFSFNEKCEIISGLDQSSSKELCMQMSSVTAPQAHKSSAKVSSFANVSRWSSVELMGSDRRERF